MLDGGGKSKKIYTYIDDISEGELLIMQKEIWRNLSFIN